VNKRMENWIYWYFC